jgi:Flp pilus assembly protein TadD
MHHFRESLDLAPYWYFTHINLGVAYQHLGQMDSARAYYDRGVEFDRYSGLGLSHRGEFRLAIHDYAGARDDFAHSATLSLDRYRNTKGLAKAYAGLGDATRSVDETKRLIELDSVSAMRDIPGISQPYFDQPTLREAGIAFYRALDQRLPGTSWIPENISRLKNLAGQRGQANPSLQAVQLASAPGGTGTAATQASLMSEGLALLRAGDASRAAKSFRQIIALNPTHYGAHYQLAVALDRSGNTHEARTVWQTVLRMAQGYHDAATEQTARTRLRAAPDSP